MAMWWLGASLSVSELNVDRFACSPHGTKLTMSVATEAEGEGGENILHSSAN